MFGENGSKDMAMRYHAADKTWQTDGVTYVVYAGTETGFWVGRGAKDFGVREAIENILAPHPNFLWCDLWGARLTLFTFISLLEAKLSYGQVCPSVGRSVGLSVITSLKGKKFQFRAPD